MGDRVVIGVFLGEFQHAMDSKGRVIIPAKFRRDLEEEFIITRGLDGCLFGYPPEEWSRIEAKLNDLPLTRRDARSFVRFFFSGACECKLDRQGRVSIPGNLREYADLEKDVVIIGVSHRIEFWSSEKWEGFIDETETAYNEYAEELEDLGI